MAEFYIRTLIETDDDEPMTPKQIRQKINQDLNRGDGLYMDVDEKCTIIRNVT